MSGAVEVEDHYNNRLSDRHAIKEVNIDDMQIEVGVDATNYKEEDIRIDVCNGMVRLHMEHNFQIDQYGVVRRRETRNFELPENVDPASVHHKLIHNTLYIRGTFRQ